eukprot:CAMPEP_0201893010 /NCGR_PEP_ID=MMETSP0902-20130614/37771_1 /ASSEMBLY_ACC=CAM_ASM_000551 /TAXON_ID=420261 /ORGANISM="Thalassiosira antarctica, Strain CCMP982" /LENGTH=157 /DNA_ID=CAMNT_0048424671 /DNA_START=8 /DNA_END=481 /DNA_ORIENTATION=+
MNTSAFETVHSILSPVDASKLSGRYETTAADRSGKPVPVLRSIRHATQELVLQGTITPKKVKRSSDDVNDLCDLFQAKARVTPNKKKPSSSKADSTPRARAPSSQYVEKKADEVDSVKENLGKALKMMHKSNTKSTRFSDDTKEAAVNPVRRSRRRA